jgi:hypothetical protein
VPSSAAVPVGPSVPLRFVVDSGPRGVVEAAVDGVPVPMLVHANAGFTVMLTHDAVQRVTGRTVDKESDYGLGHDLRVSERGRGSTVLASLEVAGARISDVRCAVFDLPTTNWEGMLGVEWLDAVRPVVDFGSRVLSIPPPGTRPVGASGDARIPFGLDERLGRYVVELLVGGAAAPFVVSTVAETTLDLGFAHERGLGLTGPIGLEHGPGGAVVPVHRTQQPISLAHAGVRLATLELPVYDTYAYRDEKRPANGTAVAGYLGADVLLATRAVADFG